MTKRPYSRGMDLSRLDRQGLHAVINDLSPNGRWFHGTRGSYARAKELRLRRRDLPLIINWCWNRIAWLYCLERKDKTGAEVYAAVCETLLGEMPPQAWWAYPKWRDWNE